MRARFWYLPLCVTALAWARPARHSIVIRHDRPDSLYLALGARFPAVAQIGRAGDGTLIADRWVLTAGHVAAGIDVDRAQVRIGGKSYDIKRAIVHPRWQELGPHDIGLLELTQPVTGVDPLPLYEGTDEQGQVAVIVGHGDTRSGKGGPWKQDGLARGAMSRIVGTDEDHLVFRFDAPPKGDSLSGAPGRGDSGGPALILRGNQALIAGVSSAGFDGSNGPGTYGAVDHFTRVSGYLSWIRAAMSGSR
ncbi:MAG: trypsin-like serine protease [Gemmatimonadota bacterium]